jgi:hypothetical protein
MPASPPDYLIRTPDGDKMYPSDAALARALPWVALQYPGIALSIITRTDAGETEVRVARLGAQ